MCSTVQHCGYLQKPPLPLTFPLSLLLNQPPQKFCPVKNNDDDDDDDDDDDMVHNDVNCRNTN